MVPDFDFATALLHDHSEVLDDLVETLSGKHALVHVGYCNVKLASVGCFRWA